MRREFIAGEEERVKDDIYAEDALENYSEDDLITAAEEGFMLGYLNA